MPVDLSLTAKRGSGLLARRSPTRRSSGSWILTRAKRSFLHPRIHRNGTARSFRPRRRHGASLIESIVALTLMSLLAAGLADLIKLTQKAHVRLLNEQQTYTVQAVREELRLYIHRYALEPNGSDVGRLMAWLSHLVEAGATEANSFSASGPTGNVPDHFTFETCCNDPNRQRGRATILVGREVVTVRNDCSTRVPSVSYALAP